MAFDQKTRNLLQRTVTACRRVFDREFTAQLQELYGIQPDGALTPCAALDHLADEQMEIARLLRSRINHLEGGEPDVALTRTQARPEHVARVIREQAFTVLNRLAALRLCEERGLVLECVRQGFNSEGFQLFLTTAGNALGATHEAYRVYLQCIFDELALDLGVLFDRFSPLALLFPRKDALEEVLREFNGSGKAGENENISAEQFAEIWQADETIGWIYQYYNDEAERKKMREESSAPRNSRELAVRNQFFTPRYVVEFLADNTVGRLWYEMRQGQTRLKDQCRFLVRRPNEVFLKPGETASEQQRQENLSQEELLKQPVHIAHRQLKDPREIRLLDPACGSMHFGLYAFDLFEVIYLEAWEIPEIGNKLKDEFQSSENYRRQIPELILRYNIHGIEIDPRAAQIAGLSLWLRAQRAWHQAGVKPTDRPRITRSNLVCAEPMPGEKELLREFIEQQFPAGERPAFAFLLEKIFDRMTLAGEAGSLLRVEEEIRTAIAEAHALAQRQSAPRQAHLYPRDERPEQLEFDLRGLNDEQFWRRAEQRIYDALEAYAEQAENGGGFQRRLFADDTAQGFAFIDLCRKRYDVAVMNPPFGDASLPSKSYIDETYGDTKGDVYKAFVESFQARLVPTGYLGIISSRTGFFLSQSKDWRTRVVLRLFRPVILADLGGGVLDAMVEVAAYVLRNLSEPEARDLTFSLVKVLEKVELDALQRFSLPKWQAARDSIKRHQAVDELERLESERYIQRCSGEIIRYTPLWPAMKAAGAALEPRYPLLVCIRVLDDEDKATALLEAILKPRSFRTYVYNPVDFRSVPGSPFAYWISRRVRELFQSVPSFNSGERDARCGPHTGDDFRLLRAWWEVNPQDVAREKLWVPYAKGGAAVRFYSDQPLVVAWDEKRFTFLGFLGRPGRWQSRLESSDCFFRPGITWPLRAGSFTPQILPAGCVFSVRGSAAFSTAESLSALMGLMSSGPFDYIFKILLGRFGFPEFAVGALQQLPIPPLADDCGRRLGELAEAGWREMRYLDSVQETSHAFTLPAMLVVSGATLADRAAAWAGQLRVSEEIIGVIQAEIDNVALQLYGFDDADRTAMTATLASESTVGAGFVAGEEEQEEKAAPAPTQALTADLLAFCLGSAFGHWDIRYATGQKPVSEPLYPFVPLPVCPPGMLQGDDGLPLSPELGRRLRSEGRYPLDVAWDGILVDDPEHSLDLNRRVHAALAVLLDDRADAMEHEACALLGVPTLRDWFRRPSRFFADHLRRYSKSQRQAPIYWPLSTTSGSYTLWLYYHRLTPDTLYKCLQQFVVPKLGDVEKELTHVRTVLAASEGGTKERKRVEELEGLRRELIELRTELELWAPKWKPNLNDGVLITASPLWKLFRLPRWQKDLKACWHDLERGDYDWAHLANTLWPDRVREKCKIDRSLAIAHGVEDLCELKAPAKKKRKSGARSTHIGIGDGTL